MTLEMKRLFKGKFVRQFLPFMILVIGGSFITREFVGLKYKYPKIMSHDLDIEIKKQGIEMKKSRTIEEEYEQMKTVNIDNWKNIRISRPWDESND